MEISIALPNSLRNEEEIIAGWNGDISKPLVSIRCATFNHVNYIEDAIKGFLIQETDFPFEIWIHDDASTDGTRAIIERYQALYPRLIKSILQTENQYSKGNKPGRILMEKCLGRYCAVCEGDDFWIDPRKLQNQAEVLERNPTLNMVIHPALKINAITGDRDVIGRYRSDNGLVPLADIITKKYGQIPTASTFVRSSVNEKVISFRDKNPYLTVGDIYLHIFGAEKGWAFYLNDVCSVYRQFLPGSWTSTQLSSHKDRARHITLRIKSFKAIKSELPVHSHPAVDAENCRRVMSLFSDPGSSVFEKLDYFRRYHELLDLRSKARSIILCFIPRIFVRHLILFKQFLFGKRTPNQQ